MRFLVLTLILLFVGCGTPKESAQVPSNREITEQARILGDKISLAAQTALGGQLKKAMSDGGPANAVQFCNEAAYPILDTLNTPMNVSIRRASLRVRNMADTPTDPERKILKDYQGQIERKEELIPVVKVLPTDQLLYAKPIILNNALCLSCHGKVGAEINEETYNLISQLYPNDDAVDHEMGDLRGIWSITFGKEELVKYLKEKGS